MQWFWIALAAPLLWGMVNHVDKFIISKYFSGKGIGSLVIFTSLSGFLFSIFIALFYPSALSITVFSAIIIAFNGALLVASFIPYLHALEHEEPSMITALFQIIPVFGYFLALFFLDEHLTISQILSSLLILAGGIVISLDLSLHIRFKLKPFLWMLLSTFMLAVNGLIFKIVALDENFWGTAFWEYIGGAIFGIFLLVFIPLYRKQFFATIEKSRAMVLGLNSIAELLNIIAKLLANFASLSAPLALVWVVNGVQPLVVFIYGVILTLFFPQIGKETLDRTTIVQRVFSIILIFTGVYFLL